MPLPERPGFFSRWLPRVFGCHCRPDRSFFFRGRQLPLCARCTGQLAGILLAVPWGAAFGFPPVWACGALLLPLAADGFLQALTPYESTNPRRLATGVLFGFGLAALFALSTRWVFLRGAAWGAALAGRGAL